jgi:hypothetical protein
VLLIFGSPNVELPTSRRSLRRPLRNGAAALLLIDRRSQGLVGATQEKGQYEDHNLIIYYNINK